MKKNIRFCLKGTKIYTILSIRRHTLSSGASPSSQRCLMHSCACLPTVVLFYPVRHGVRHWWTRAYGSLSWGPGDRQSGIPPEKVFAACCLSVSWEVLLVLFPQTLVQCSKHTQITQFLNNKRLTEYGFTEQREWITTMMTLTLHPGWTIRSTALVWSSLSTDGKGWI